MPVRRNGTLVGRDAELEALERQTMAARSGVSFVIGPAGIGKSAVLREFAERTNARAYVEIEASQDVPLSALIDALDVPGELPSDRDELTTMLFDALEARARRGIGVLILDNVHSLDIASIRFLTAAVERAGVLPLHLVMASRSSAEIASRVPRTFVMEAERDVRTIHMVALDDVTIVRLVEERISHDFSAEQRRWFVDYAEGNPHSALELAEASAAAGRAGFRPVEHTVAAAVLRKRSLLEPQARGVLDTAAAIGRRFDPALLATALAREPLDIAPALRAAIDVGLLLENESGADFRFKHELTQDAIYSALLVFERRELHAKIAENVERAARTASADAVAYDQWTRAARFDRAEGPGRRTIQRAMERFAYDDVIVICERLIAIAERNEDRASLLDTISTAHSYSGRLSEAREALSTALEACALSSDRELRARLTHRYATIAYNMFDAAASEEALDTIPLILGEASQSPWLYRAYVSKALGAVQRGDVVAASEHLDRAHAIETTEVPALDRATLRRTRSELAAALGDVEAWSRWSERALELAIASGQVNRQVTVRIAHAIDARSLGEFDAGLIAVEAARRQAESSRQRGYAAYALALHAWFLLDRGEIERARDESEAALAQGGMAVDVALIVRGLCAAHELDQQRFDRLNATATLESARRSGSALQVAMVATALVRAARAFARPDEARRTLVASLRALVSPYACSELVALTPEHGTMDDIAFARALFKARPLGPRDRAHAELFEARVARREGRERRATAHGLAAARAFEALGMRIAKAEALHVAGRREAALDLAIELGDRALEREIAGARASRNARGREAQALTRRELQIATLVGDDLTNRDIAAKLSIGERTVETHVATILRKTGATTRREIGDFLRRPARP